MLENTRVTGPKKTADCTKTTRDIAVHASIRIEIYSLCVSYLCAGVVLMV